MFPYRLAITAAGLVGALAGVGYLGYDYGRATSDAALLDKERAATAVISQALADYAALEAKSSAAAAALKRATSRRVTEIRYVAAALPDRDCPVRPDARSLYVQAICAHPRNADRPECVLAGVPGSGDAAPGGKPGSGAGPMDH